MARKQDFWSSLYLPLLMLYCIVSSWHPLGGGFDFFAHSAVGRWIWDHHAVPKYGLFVWSAPHYPWVAHSWLSQLLFFLILKVGGPFLVMALTVAGTCLVFGMIWRFWQRRGPIPFVVPLLFCLAIFVSMPRFFPRQEMITAIFLVILLRFLIEWRDATKVNWKSNLAILAMFVLWINLHALVVLGLVLMVATAGSDALQYRFDSRSKVLALLAALCLAATLVNPFGWHYWAAAEVLKSGSQASFVDEWKPFWVKPLLSWRFVAGESFLVLVAFVAWLRSPRPRLAHLPWLILLFVMFIMSRRQLWMLAITALMVMAANACSFDSEAWWRGWRKLSRQPELPQIPIPLRRAAHVGSVCIVLLCIVLISRIFTHEPSEFWPPRGVSQHAPVKVAALIANHHLRGNIFNDYENSSYLQWRLNGVDPKTGHVPSAGLHPLFLDLLNAYPDKILTNDYFDILAAKKRGLALLESRHINIVQLGPDHREEKLAKYLNHNVGWKKLVDGKEGLLWVRRKPI